MQIAAASPLCNDTIPLLNEVKEAVARLRGGRVPDVCNFSMELLRPGASAMIHGLYVVLTAVWQSGTISSKSLSETGKGFIRNVTTTVVLHSLLPQGSACPAVAHSDTLPLAEYAETRAVRVHARQVNNLP